jgi:hypothetical protein
MIGFVAIAILNIPFAISTYASGAQKPIIVPELAGGISLTIVFDDPGFFEAARQCFDQYSFDKFGASADERQKKCLADYMTSHGAGAPAIAFMRAAPVPSTVLAVRAYGAVAVVHAAMLWADGSDGWAIIDKPGELIPLWTPPDIDADPAYREFIRQHPGASLWSDTIGWPQIASAANGTRLTFDFSLKVCHACARLGRATVIYNFDLRGSFQKAQLQQIVAQPVL